jgi:chromosome segregation ATPase
LKTARLAQKAGGDEHVEVERLTKELEAKNQIITKLQTDDEEQRRKLSKLRGTESETLRLKAATEKDRGEIEALQREIAQLRDALAQQTADAAAAASNNNAGLEAKLKERESSVTRLMGTIKEHESTIKKLTESAQSWKRKYEFLATDQPDAYKNAGEK